MIGDESTGEDDKYDGDIGDDGIELYEDILDSCKLGDEALTEGWLLLPVYFTNQVFQHSSKVLMLSSKLTTFNCHLTSLSHSFSS